MAKWIHNLSGSTKNYHNSDITDGSFYLIPVNLLSEYQSSDSLISDLALGYVKMSSDGDNDLTGTGSDHVDFLKGRITYNVQTQFERDDLILKICSGQSSVGGDSTATVDIKVPGVYANGDVVYISGGDCWFDEQHKDDRVLEIEVIDIDDVLGYGANVVLKTYHDSDVPEENQGWRIPIKYGHIYAETLGFYGIIPAELYIRVKGKKGGSLTTGTMYLNIEWGRIG